MNRIGLILLLIFFIKGYSQNRSFVIKPSTFSFEAYQKDRNSEKPKAKIEILYEAANYYSYFNYDSAIVLSNEGLGYSMHDSMLLWKISFLRIKAYSFISKLYFDSAQQFLSEAEHFMSGIEKLKKLSGIDYFSIPNIQLGDIFLSQLTLYRALLYSRTEDKKHAILFYQKVISLSKSNNDTLALIASLANNAGFLEKTRLYDSAIVTSREALSLLQDYSAFAGNSFEKYYYSAICSRIIANAYSAKNIQDSSFYMLRSALKFIVDRCQMPTMIRVYEEIGKHYEKMKSEKLFIQYIDSAICYARMNNLEAELSRFYLIKSNYYFRNGMIDSGSYYQELNLKIENCKSEFRLNRVSMLNSSCKNSADSFDSFYRVATLIRYLVYCILFILLLILISKLTRVKS